MHVPPLPSQYCPQAPGHRNSDTGTPQRLRRGNTALPGARTACVHMCALQHARVLVRCVTCAARVPGVGVAPRGGHTFPSPGVSVCVGTAVARVGHDCHRPVHFWPVCCADHIGRRAGRRWPGAVDAVHVGRSLRDPVGSRGVDKPSAAVVHLVLATDDGVELWVVVWEAGPTSRTSRTSGTSGTSGTDGNPVRHQPALNEQGCQRVRLARHTRIAAVQPCSRAASCRLGNACRGKKPALALFPGRRRGGAQARL